MKYIPLAEAVRPINLDDFLGQKHLLNNQFGIKKQIKNGYFVSTIFWGPPGTGKTTLARIICSNLHLNFNELSAVSSTLSDVRKIIAKSEKTNQTEVLFLDEIHRFNKTQQDALLPAIESGNILLIGATTENPSFGIIPALRSRVRLLEFKPLIQEELMMGLKKTEEYIKKNINNTFLLNEEVAEILIKRANGDLRKSINLLENLILTFANDDFNKITKDELLQYIPMQYIKYDKKSDEHYDHASAFQKSIRGSEPNAAIYWLGKMLKGGEDPRFIARRLIITAAEDIGLADPQALLLANAALDAVSKVGMPEARIILTQAVLYAATAPKSNSTIKAIDKVFTLLDNGEDYPVPPQLQDSHFANAKEQGRGKGYSYPHNSDAKHIEYLPYELQNEQIYNPVSENEKVRIKKILPQKQDLFISEKEIQKVIDWIKYHENEFVSTSDIEKDTEIERKKIYKILQKLEAETTIYIETKAKIILQRKL